MYLCKFWTFFLKSLVHVFTHISIIYTQRELIATDLRKKLKLILISKLKLILITLSGIFSFASSYWARIILKKLPDTLLDVVHCFCVQPDSALFISIIIFIIIFIIWYKIVLYYSDVLARNHEIFTSTLLA